MTALPARFTFDLDLAATAEEAALISEAAHADLARQARATGYAEGLSAGERSATTAAAQSLALAANAIAERATGLLAALDAEQARAEERAIGLASALGKKLAGGLIAEEPTAELTALLSDCLASLGAVPHLVIRCHPDLAEKIRDGAAPRIAQSGFAGRLVVMGEPEIALGDGRIEWADGGLVRDQDAILADIDRAIAGYIAARRARRTPEETEP
jgi:flagellar assembly protein FliH